MIQELRLLGILVAAYLDNWLIWAESPEECRLATQIVFRFLQQLGFLIKFKKYNLTPQIKFIWLGLHRDLENHSLSLPQEKRWETAKLVGRLKK